MISHPFSSSSDGYLNFVASNNNGKKSNNASTTNNRKEPEPRSLLRYLTHKHTHTHTHTHTHVHTPERNATQVDLNTHEMLPRTTRTLSPDQKSAGSTEDEDFSKIILNECDKNTNTTLRSVNTSRNRKNSCCCGSGCCCRCRCTGMMLAVLVFLLFQFVFLCVLVAYYSEIHHQFPRFAEWLRSIKHHSFISYIL